jgi:3,4-dihydroxy 2-butanone 4-phosphate synthase / GTP cyclohydrolase II
MHRNSPFTDVQAATRACGLSSSAADEHAEHGTLRHRISESIDALCRGITTGTSAHDHAETILCAIDPQASPSDLGRPGHVFPYLGIKTVLL